MQIFSNEKGKGKKPFPFFTSELLPSVEIGNMIFFEKDAF